MRRVLFPRKRVRAERDLRVDHDAIDRIEQLADEIGLEDTLEHRVAVALDLSDVTGQRIGGGHSASQRTQRP